MRIIDLAPPPGLVKQAAALLAGAFESEARARGRCHRLLFHRRMGLVVTGIMPDANGRGRPDILMSKPIRR